MSDSDGSVVDRVRSALEKSGYPLEMRVAKAAQAHHPQYVHQSRYYLDRDTHKVRETDVLVCWQALFRDDKTGQHVWTAFYLVIECKSKPAPWVVFDEGAEPTRNAAMRLDLAVTRELEHSDFLHRMVAGQGMEETLFGPSRIGSGITAPTGDGKGTDDAWSAVRSAVSAAHGFMHDVPPMDEGSPVHIVVQPVVVTSGALCRAYLDDKNQIQVEEVQVAEVTVRHGEDPVLTRCLVVQESYVDDLMGRALKTAQRFGYTDLTMVPPVDINPSGA